MRIEPATTDDVELLADQWVDLAREQRAHDTHILPEPNRPAVREELLRRTITGEVLVARDGDRSGKDSGTGEARADGETPAGGEDGDGEVTTESGDILGFVSFGIESGGLQSDANRGVVYNLYVVPDRRGEGIGGDLLSAAERRLADAGADRVGLEAMAANEAARRFYRRQGYEVHRVEFERPLDDVDAQPGDRSPGSGEDTEAAGDSSATDDPNARGETREGRDGGG